MDRVLGLMLSASGGKSITFDRVSFQKFARLHGKRWTRDTISNGLQAYRRARVRQYTVSAMGYGTVSRWRLIGVAGAVSIPRSKMTKEQAQWLVHDSLKRERNDLMYEWIPAAKANGVEFRNG